MAGRRHADGRADRIRAEARARPLLRGDDRDRRAKPNGSRKGEWPADDNPLVNAPHTAAETLAGDWTHPYSRLEAAYPAGDADTAAKYWPPVSRIDNVAGDRNLVCSCPPMEALAS